MRARAHVREEMATQVVAGADILLAPTWLTHRRALVPVGETRRVREWTTAAVTIAHEGAELGRERLGGGHVPLVLGVLPDPAPIDEAATGRLPAPDAAVERDERAQAAILADSDVDGILIEARPSLARARAALRAVVETDLPAWIVVPGERPDGLSLDAWLDELAADGAALLLLETADASARERSPEGRFGVMAPGPLREADPRGTVAGWIAMGAHILGLASDATPESLGPLVEARDAAVEAATGATAAIQAELNSCIRDAARRAAGGRALWVGDAPASLPDGFAWTVVPITAVGSLPPGSWRLLVSVAELDPRDSARLVERGGIITAPTTDPDALVATAGTAGVRLDEIRPSHGNLFHYIGRRED